MSTIRTQPEPHVLAPWAGALLALGVLASHLPFVTPGYGTDTDAWKFASAIREMSLTGRYTASRLPGYPVVEMLSTPLARLGPWAPNTLSALAAAACAWLAARLFARHGVRDALLAGAAFVLLPAFIAGTSSMGDLWALATRPARFVLVAGNMTSMVYHLFPEPPRERQYVRSYDPAAREQARRAGIPIYALPDVARRMALNERVPAIPGLIPLAGVQDTP